ncbi:GntR family transcriptional regulator [Polymorphospora lycopeni]|uniref:GntR family transcriptional regulator n=1 Tax=Polymorphospora lycopeni TaxID=3140240 RepID=A0ABV5CY30_9ACTN
MREPEYRRVAADLRAKIESGELAPGQVIPSESDLMAQYGVGRNTVRAAVSELAAVGLVAGRQGKGRYVRQPDVLRVWGARVRDSGRESDAGLVDKWTEDVSAQGRIPGQVIEVHLLVATDEIAQRLQVSTGEPVVVRRRIQTVDGDPWRLSETYFPLDLVAGTRILEPVNIEEGVVRYLANLGQRVTLNKDELSARMPTVDEARILALAVGTPVLVQLRTAYDGAHAVRTSRVVTPGDRVRLIYEMKSS